MTAGSWPPRRLQIGPLNCFVGSRRRVKTASKVFQRIANRFVDFFQNVINMCVRGAVI